MEPISRMKISEFGRRANVGPKTIRYYEDRGLLPRPHRCVNGYRSYGEEDLRRLEFIRCAQTAGLSLQAISELLDVIDRGESPCCLTRTLARDRIDEIDAKLRALERVRERLTALLASDQQTRLEETSDLMCQLIGV